MVFQKYFVIFLCCITLVSCTEFSSSLFQSRAIDKLLNIEDVCSLLDNPELGCLHPYAFGLCNGEGWAMQMFDATGKIPTGILDGNLYELGSYDECLAVDNKTLGFTGQYCLSSITIAESLTLSLGLCVPSTCEAQEIEALGGFIIKLANIKNVTFNINDGFCQSEKTKPEVTTGDILCIIFFAIMIFLMISSTLYESYLYYAEKEPRWDVLLSFALLKNGRKLFTVIDKPNQLNCIAGIRTLSMMWVILGHGFKIAMDGAVENTLYIFTKWFTEVSSMYILGATVSVDSFFLMGGIVLIYVFMGSMKKNQFFNIPMYYVHRYLRLTPALGAMVLVHSTVLKHFGSGPLWPLEYKNEIHFCKEYWWSTLLYVQNYVNPEGSCVGQSWYLSIDMQLFILSPLILIPLRKYANITIMAVAGLTAASIAGTFYIGWHYSIPGVLDLSTSTNFINKYYLATHTRAAPWLIGIIVGFYVYKYKQVDRPFRIPRILNVVLWIASLLVLCACVFAGNTLINPAKFNKLDNSMYLALVRPAWAVALSWVIFASVTGYGGPINAFLSLPIFQILSRFTYSMYIVHYTIISTITLTTRTTTIISDFTEMTKFWNHFALTFGLALIWTLMFESPIIELEKLIFGFKTKPKEEKEISKIQNSNENYQIPKARLRV